MPKCFVLIQISGMLVMRPWICGSGTTSRTGMTAFPWNIEYEPAQGGDQVFDGR